MDFLLKDYYPGRLHQTVRRLAGRWFYLRHGILERRYGRLVTEEIEGVPLLVLPEVFNPVLFRTGALLARSVAALPPAGWAGLNVLDLGTGAGAGAIFAARRGARVLATDLNPEAVRNARLNALLNELEDRIETVQGDLFGPAAGQQFDRILFNPPFYRGKPRHNLDFAWRGTDVFERFMAGLAGMLRPGGQALLVLSTDGDSPRLLRLLVAAGFTVAVVARQNAFSEILTVYQVYLPGFIRNGVKL